MDLCGKYYLLGATEGSWFTLPRSEEPLDLPHARSWQIVLGSERRGGGRQAGACLCTSSCMNHNNHGTLAHWADVPRWGCAEIASGFVPRDQSQQPSWWCLYTNAGLIGLCTSLLVPNICTGSEKQQIKQCSCWILKIISSSFFLFGDFS